MKHLTTHIGLPVGPLPDSVVREFLRQVFETYRWFRPERYGYASLDGRVDPAAIDYDALLACYKELKVLTIAARTDRDYLLISPVKPGEPPYAGEIIWASSAREATKPAWRSAHLQQVLEVMGMMEAPLAQAGTDEDLEGKQWRRIRDPEGFSTTETFTVRDYSEGLSGLFWRNFFGPPFVRMFGERLDSLAGEFKQELGGGIVLVQPYELPTLAGTLEGDARERQLIAHLGPECFYDHQRHLKPTRVPELR